MNTTTRTKDVADVIRLTDLENIWDHLQKTFGLNVYVYQQGFKKHVELFHHNAYQPEFIIEYGLSAIQPVLNKMLQRESDYPTWINMLRFLLKEKLAENTEQRNYYRSGEWKSSVRNKADDVMHLHISGHSI